MITIKYTSLITFSNFNKFNIKPIAGKETENVVVLLS
jgi:hypothetical protein